MFSQKAGDILPLPLLCQTHINQQFPEWHLGQKQTQTLGFVVFRQERRRVYLAHGWESCARR